MSRSFDLLLLCLGLVCVGCGESYELLVDVKSDLRPGIAFTSLETTVTPSGGDEQRTSLSVFTADDYFGGVRVGEFSGVDAGSTTVRITLLDRDGLAVLSRRVLVELREDTGITVLMTGDCVEFECPLAGGDAQLTECLAGMCVMPQCYVENREACPDAECASDGECAFSATCAQGACVDSFCFGRADDGMCGVMEYCDPEVGCRMLEPMDGGALDTGPADSGMDSGPCVPGAPCTTSLGCEVGELDCSGGMTVCRPTGVAPDGTECRPAETCDIAEVCDGISPACPIDALAPAGTMCATGFCDGLGGCGACSDGAPCATGLDCETGAIDCSGGAPVCVGAGPISAGTVCRPAVDICDVEETCDGSGTSCPSDGFLASGMECRASTAPCDAAEVCDGSAPTCPVDSLAIAGTVCRIAAGSCDLQETCDGVSGSCPADVFSGAVCRMSAGSCDLEERCSGASPTCPGNSFRPSSFMCGGPAGICTLGRFCTGSSAGCPGAQTPRPMGTTCQTTFICGADRVCKTCNGAGACSNVPAEFNGACRPSCGGLRSFCGGTPRCCPSPMSCSSSYGVSTFDCDDCCDAGPPSCT